MRYEQCFVGSEAVNWMMKKYNITRFDFVDNRQTLFRKQSIKLGNKLMSQKLISHVANEHLFADAYLFYKICAQSSKHESHQMGRSSRAKYDQVVKEGFLGRLSCLSR
jgi:hypothetical protein